MDLSSMSVDDFMRTDWGSEDSADPDDNKDTSDKGTSTSKPQRNENSDKASAGKKKRKKKKKMVPKESAPNKIEEAKEKRCAETKKTKSVSSHQQMLNKLKDKDPEFYKFLQQEDESLLNFDENDLDLDASSDDEDEDTGIHKLPEKLEVASDSDMEEDIDEGEMDGSESELELETAAKAQKKAQIMVTEKTVEDWKDKLTDSNSSVPALRELMKAFSAAIVRFSHDDDDKKKKSLTKYKVDTGSVFNAVVGLCIRQVVPSLAKILNYYPEKSSKKHALPSHSKTWVKVRDLMRNYLPDVIALNDLLLEPTVVCATLRHTLLLIPYYVTFPKITKLLLKFLVKSWSSSEDESARVLSFLCINRIIKLDRKRYLETVLKQTYLAYVANCKFTSPTTLPMINFMQQTLCELLALNPSVTYQLAFLYIRQLAIHLRKAMTIRKKETCQAVYNWQYVHCLGLWCRMVGNLYSKSEIRPLLYPLVQVSLGTIDLVPTARYFPLRFHILRYLTILSDATNTYIPLLPYLTKPLRLTEFGKKKEASSMKPLNFSTILKLSNFQLKEGVYRASTMDEVYFGLMEYINTQAHTISFSEMMVPTVVSLKKYVKNSKVAAYCKLMRQIIDKVQENSKYILEKRSSVPFSVTDVHAVTNWEKTIRENGVPFHKHYEQYKKLREREVQQAVADKNRIVEERLPVVDRQKFLELSKAKDREEFGDLFAEGEETLEDLEFNVEKIVDECKLRKPAPQNPKLSDDEEEYESLEDEGGDSCENEEVKHTESKLKNKSLKRESCNGKDVSLKKKKLDDSDDGEPDIVEDFELSDEEGS